MPASLQKQFEDTLKTLEKIQKGIIKLDATVAQASTTTTNGTVLYANRERFSTNIF